MPFTSIAQVRFMAKNHPEIFERWKKKYGIKKGLPQHAKKK